MLAVEPNVLGERIAELRARHPMVGLSMAVVRGASTEFCTGAGFADLARRTPISQTTVFRIASITKTFTALGIMQLVQRGLIDLDAPATDYLRAYRLIPAWPGFGPVTVRQLLTHTGGIGETTGLAAALRPDFGESVDAGARAPDLGEFYRRGVRVVAEPGTRWAYTDHGFATLGQIIADVTGVGLAQYLRANVFEPLGMTDTDLEPPPRLRSRIATGYVMRGDGPRAVRHREMITAGASAAYSTTRDMTRYLSALLNGGANDFGAVVESNALATMFAPQYQPDPRIPGLGLAFFRGTAGGHRIVEHQGILPGFTSQLWLAPDDGIGIFACTNGAHRAMLWLPAEISGLMNDLLGVPDPRVRTDIAHRPEVWPDICGIYRLRGPMSDIRARMMIGAGVQIRIEGGRPILRVLTPVPGLLRGLPLLPDDPDDPTVFRIDLTQFGIPSGRIVFGREPRSAMMRLSFELAPISLYRDN